MAIAKAGLSLSPESTTDPYAFTSFAKPRHNSFEFASWTSDLAEGLGDTQTAIEARVIAFKEKPSFQESQPEWVIAEGKKRTEPTMDQKKSDRYQEAVDWLKQGRLGYIQLGQKEQWKHYRQELVNAHARKYKLMELFKQKGME